MLCAIPNLLFMMRRVRFQSNTSGRAEQAARAAAAWLRQEPTSERLLLFRANRDKRSADLNPIWYNYRLNYFIYPRHHDNAWDVLPADAARRYDLVIAFGSAQQAMMPGWKLLRQVPAASLLTSAASRLPGAAGGSKPPQPSPIRLLAGIFSLAVVVTLGALLLSLTTRVPPFDAWWANLAIAHLIGATALTWIVTVLAILTGRLLIWPIYILLFLLAIIQGKGQRAKGKGQRAKGIISNFYLTLSKLKMNSSRWKSGFSFPLSLFPFLLLFLGLLLLIQRGWLLGVGWDGYSIWQFKAQAFVIHGDLSLLRDVAYADYAHYDYPLLVPLQTWWTAAHVGAYGERWAQGIGLLFALDLIAVFVAFVRSGISPQRILLGVALLVSMPELAAHAVSGFADIEMACYLLVLGVFLARVLVARERVMLPVLIWMFAGIALVKNEGLLACVSGLAVILLATVPGVENTRPGGLRPTVLPDGKRLTNFRRDVLVCTAQCVFGACIAYLPWLLLKRAWHLNNDLLQPAVPPHFTFSLLAWRLGYTLFSILLSLLPITPTPGGLRPGNWGLLILPLVVGLAAAVRHRVKISWPLWQLCALQFAGYILIYLITPHPLANHLASSLDRLQLHVMPTLLLAALLGCFAEPLPSSAASAPSAGASLEPS